MAHGILIHEPGDDVGVAVMDLTAGTQVGAVTLEGKFVGSVELIEDVPLGHKVAMRAVAEGADVRKYGRAIGYAAQPIPVGAHVHTHNLKTKRWRL